MQIESILASVQAKLKTGNATEHSYRSAIEALMKGLREQVTADNEPKRETSGAPAITGLDFLVLQILRNRIAR